MAAELFAGGIRAPHSDDMVKSVEAAHDGAAAFALQGMGGLCTVEHSPQQGQ